MTDKATIERLQAVVDLWAPGYLVVHESAAEMKRPRVDQNPGDESAFRIRGEWFMKDDSVMRFVRKLIRQDKHHE